MIELIHGKEGWYWADVYTTTRDYRTEKAARAAMKREIAACKKLGLDPDGLASAGILEWVY